MTFPGFQEQMEWCQSCFRKSPWKPIHRMLGSALPRLPDV